MKAEIKVAKYQVTRKYLSWTEILQEEGIYVPLNYLDERIVVIKCNNITQAIFVKDNKIEPANVALWQECVFTRSNESFSCSIK